MAPIKEEFRPWPGERAVCSVSALGDSLWAELTGEEVLPWSPARGHAQLPFKPEKTVGASPSSYLWHQGHFLSHRLHSPGPRPHPLSSTQQAFRDSEGRLRTFPSSCPSRHVLGVWSRWGEF